MQAPADVKTNLRYGNVVPNKRRKLPSGKITSESVQIGRKDRDQSQANAQQQMRDLSLLAWMVRRHLDYVSSFRFNFKTAADEADAAKVALDDYIHTLFNWHAIPDRFDVAARLGREEGFRLFELEKTIAGDAGMLKIPSLLVMQMIESDLIAKPKTGKLNAKGKAQKIPQNVERTVHPDDGCIYNRTYAGRVDQWCLCSRGLDGKGLHFDQLVDRTSMIFDGYFTRYSSQTRGVSPLTTALNSCSDIYNGIDLQLAKARIHALFGIAVFRDYSGGDYADEFGEGAADEETEAPVDGTTDSGVLAELAPDQMTMVDMDTNGKIDLLESKTPSAEFRDFIETVARIVLISLDIPYTAYNSAASSFSGIMADQNMYEVACKHKRRKNEWARKSYSDWLIEQAFAKNSNIAIEGDIATLAQAAGYTMAQVQSRVEWISSGMPWLQQMQEVQGEILAIASGADNPVDIARSHGTDVWENIRKTGEVLAFAEQHGVPLVFAQSGSRSMAEVLMAAEPETEPEVAQ